MGVDDAVEGGDGWESGVGVTDVMNDGGAGGGGGYLGEWSGGRFRVGMVG